MNYLVSLVVPTKNRYKYLRYLIQLIDSFKLPELEMVVQDNSDDNSEILEYLKGFDNPNIKYFYVADKLTMSGNAERGIMNATGEYICYIGDDDGVCRNIVEVVKWMKANKIEAAYSHMAWFSWTGRAKLFKSRKAYVHHNSSYEIKRLLHHGLILSDVDMPLIYHGIVLRLKLIDLRNKIGTCFPATPPDIAGSIALSSVVNVYYQLNTPVIINGISYMAGGGVLNKGGVIPLEDVPFINKSDIEKWEKFIPPVWCGHYAWTNAGIKTLIALDHKDFFSFLNIDYSLAGAVAQRPRNNQLRHYSFQYAQNKKKYICLLFVALIKKYFKKFTNNCRLFVIQSNKIESIIEAEAFFTKHCKHTLD